MEEMLPKRVSMLSGLRRGDILALDWKDYERDNKGKPTFRTVTKKYAAKMATESSRKIDGENHPSLSGISSHCVRLFPVLSQIIEQGKWRSRGM